MVTAISLEELRCSSYDPNTSEGYYLLDRRKLLKYTTASLERASVTTILGNLDHHCHRFVSIDLDITA